MKSVAFVCATLGLALVVTSCVTYTGVSKSADGELYISGGTSYVVYSSPWIRRCKVDGEKLDCVELSEKPPAPAGSGSAAAAPAPAASSEPAASPPSQPEPTPDKSKK